MLDKAQTTGINSNAADGMHSSGLNKAAVRAKEGLKSIRAEIAGTAFDVATVVKSELGCRFNKVRGIGDNFIQEARRRPVLLLGAALCAGFVLASASSGRSKRLRKR